LARQRKSPPRIQPLSKSGHAQLQREMTRKDKALAEAAALLILQKKVRALWEAEDA
jgi:hypothetical protein